MSVKLGDPQTKKLTTGRLYFTRTGDPGAIDLGNIISHKYNPEIARAMHKQSQAGYKQMDFNLVNSVHIKYEFTLDEITLSLLCLMLLGTAGADVTQASGNIAAEALTASSKAGRTYFAAAVGISAYVVKVGAAVKVEGTDYTIDPGSGAVTIIPGGGIADASAVTIDYTKALVVTNVVTMLKELRAAGSFRFVETDQFSVVPRAVHTFNGQCQINDWGDNTGDDYNQVKLEVMATGNPLISLRKD